MFFTVHVLVDNVSFPFLNLNDRLIPSVLSAWFVYFRDAMICVRALYDQVHRACTQLDELADRRLCLLNHRLQLAVFEEQTTDVSALKMSSF